MVMIKRFVSILFVCLCVIFIFNNSSKVNDVSQEESLTVVNTITDYIYENVDENDYTVNEDKLNYIVRKNAHAFEYMLLAISVSLSFYCFNVRLTSSLGYIGFFCMLTAALDEYYQNFVTGRHSSVFDVLVDTTGGIFGVLIFVLIYNIYFKYFRRVKSEKLS